MRRQLISFVLILAQLSAPLQRVYAQPELSKGTQAPISSSSGDSAATPPDNTMSLGEARQVIGEAEKTLLIEVVGEPEVAIPPEKKQKFRVLWRKLIEANHRVNFIPGKNSFISWWSKNETEVLEKRGLLKNGSLQTFMVVSVVVAVAVATNAHYDLIPFGKWMDQAIHNPELRAASVETVNQLGEIAGFVLTKVAEGFIAGASFVSGIAVTVLTFSILSSLMTAFISRPKNVMEQKLNSVSGIVFGPFTKWLTGRLDKATDFASRTHLKLTNLNRRVKGLPPLTEDANIEDLQNITRNSLSPLQQLQAHWRSEGLNTSMSRYELEKIVERERSLWAELQNNYLNNFVETQRTGRANMWEAVYYSPQHFAQVVRAALSSADNFYENYERAKERIQAELGEDSGEVNILGKKLKVAIREVYWNQIRNPELAQTKRLEVNSIKDRLLEMGADPDDVKLMEERLNKYMIAKNEAVMNLVILLRRDVEFGVWTIDLPEIAYERLLKVRGELGLDYYLRELRQEVIALGEDFELNLIAYENFIEVYKALRVKAEAAKERRAKARKANLDSVPAKKVKAQSSTKTCDEQLK